MSTNTFVAAVCGAQVRIYGELDEATERRPLVRVLNMRHYGEALQYAEDFNDHQRGTKPQGKK